MRLANCIVQHGLSHEHAWQAAHQVDTLEIHLPGGYSRVKASSAILANNALLRDSQVTAILDRYRLVAPPRPKRAHSHTHAHAFHNLGDADYLRLAAQYGVSMTRELVRSTRSYY
jgi:hypothetical protein